MLLPFITAPLASIGIISGLFSCPTPTPVKVDVQFQMENMRLDNSKNRQQLEQLGASSISPTHSGDFKLINGLTNSNIESEATTSFSATTQPMMKKSCMWIDSVTVRMKYAPIVYIANSYATNSCRYSETMKHELRHVKVDIQSTNSYISYIKQAVENAVNGNRITAPFYAGDMQRNQDNLAKLVNDTVQNSSAKMHETIKVRQRQIDTREEYERLSKICPNEPNM